MSDRTDSTPTLPTGEVEARRRIIEQICAEPDVHEHECREFWFSGRNCPHEPDGSPAQEER